MIERLQNLASLSVVDVRLDELKEDLGDLPKKIKELEGAVSEKKTKVKETSGFLKEVIEFKGKSGKMLQDIADREKHLTEQQFEVRNNREFDAITKEIETLRKDRDNINNELRTCDVKEENLNRILADQENELNEAKKNLELAEAELNQLASGQDEELKGLLELRKRYLVNIPENLLDEYNRIRTFHDDAAVQIRKNSCSGCFSSIPPQRIVELRGELHDQLPTCENCGRILYPDYIEVDALKHVI